MVGVRLYFKLPLGQRVFNLILTLIQQKVLLGLFLYLFYPDLGLDLALSCVTLLLFDQILSYPGRFKLEV